MSELIPARDAGSPERTTRSHVPLPRSARPPAATVDLTVERADPRTGVRFRTVLVRDVSDTSPTREVRQAEIAEGDALLAQHPQWAAPEVVDGRLVLHHAVSRRLYRTAALAEWRRVLVPSAQALFPMQRPDATHLPSGALVDDVARSFFVDGLDAIGIRTRAAIMRDVVAGSGRGMTSVGSTPVSWVSLACGAAVPVLDSLDAVHDAPLVLTLVDSDARALIFAARLARSAGLVEGVTFRVLQRDLARTLVARSRLVAEIGEETASVVDALGIFEYFTDASCVKLLANAYRLLRRGGVLVVANMLADRPQLEFNRRGIGWPRVYPRSVERLVELVRRAGLPLDRTTVSVPGDGVYAVVDITR